MDKVKQYLVKLPFSTRNDINNLAGVVALCLMLIIWQRVESPELRVISTIAIAYVLLVIMIKLKAPDKKKDATAFQVETVPQVKKNLKKPSIVSKISTYTIIGLIAGSFFFKDVWLLLVGLGTSFLMGMHETIKKNKVQKILRFYCKIYVNNGFAPYVFGILSVISTLTGYYGDADPLIPVILTPSMGHGSENTMS